MNKQKVYLNLLAGVLVIALTIFTVKHFYQKSQDQQDLTTEANIDVPVTANENRLRDTIITLGKGEYIDWKIFDAIKRQTGAVFYYNNNNIPEKVILKTDLRKISLHLALKIIFKDQPIEWEYMGDNDIILRKADL